MAERNNPHNDASTELQAPKRLRSIPGVQAKPVKTGGDTAAGSRAKSDSRSEMGSSPGAGTAASGVSRAIEGGKPTAGEGAGAPSAAKQKGASEQNKPNESNEPNEPGKQKRARRQSVSQGVSQMPTGDKPQAQESTGDSTAGATNKARRRVPRWRIVATLVGVVLVAVIVSFALFSWNRWARYDDAADIQGQWYAAGTSVAVVIDDHTIRFDEKTSYEYTLDPEKKVISYRLGNLEGGGHYRFCSERQYLVVTDGDGFSKWGTAFDDLLQDASEFFGSLTGGSLQLHEGEGTIVLCRMADSEVVAAGSQSASAQAAPSSDGAESSQASGAGEEAPSGGESASEEASGESPASASSGGGETKDVFAQVADDAYEAEPSSASSKPAVQDAEQTEQEDQEDQAGQAGRAE